MILDSPDTTKLLLRFLWFNIVITLIFYLFTEQFSIDSAFLKGIATLAGIFIWGIGLHLYLHPVNTSLITQSKSLLIQFVSSPFYLILFLGLLFFTNDTRSEKAEYILVLSLMSLLWAFLLYRRIRLLEDTSHSTLNSAAQGYSVLEGKVTLYEGEIIRGPNHELPPMVWYKDFLFSSSAGFLLNDEKGICTVDPKEAEVITPRHYYGSTSYHAIFPGETIYIIGQLETLSKQRNEFERKSLVTSKIMRWKKHPIRFLDYFDRNKDGIIDDGEMAIVRSTAARIVEDDLEEIYQEPASHVISRPNDGRPFIISSIHPENLLTRYKYAMVSHVFAWVTLSIFALIMQV